jgi:hypothetical protein
MRKRLREIPCSLTSSWSLLAFFSDILPPLLLLSVLGRALSARPTTNNRFSADSYQALKTVVLPIVAPPFCFLSVKTGEFKVAATFTPFGGACKVKYSWSFL